MHGHTMHGHTVHGHTMQSHERKKCMILYILKFMIIDRSQGSVIVLTILMKVWSQSVSF
jgi:methyl coenzyme M reductase gamma subunit